MFMHVTLFCHSLTLTHTLTVGYMTTIRRFFFSKHFCAKLLPQRYTDSHFINIDDSKLNCLDNIIKDPQN